MIRNLIDTCLIIKVETVGFHPTVHGLVSTSAGTTTSVWDITRGAEVFQFGGHEDKVQSVSWQQDGKLIATQSKEKILRYW